MEAKVKTITPWRERNRESERARARAYYKQNKKEILRKEKETNKLFPEKRRKVVERFEMKQGKSKRILAQTKYRAKKINCDFNLEVSDIIIPDRCPVLDIELVINKKKPKYNSISVDRIEPKLGYTKGNIQIMSYQANAMKQNATPEELLKFAEWVQKTYAIKAVPTAVTSGN